MQVQKYKNTKVQNAKSKGRFPCSTNSQKYVQKDTQQCKHITIFEY